MESWAFGLRAHSAQDLNSEVALVLNDLQLEKLPCQSKYKQLEDGTNSSQGLGGLWWQMTTTAALPMLEFRRQD